MDTKSKTAHFDSQAPRAEHSCTHTTSDDGSWIVETREHEVSSPQNVSLNWVKESNVDIFFLPLKGLHVPFVV